MACNFINWYQQRYILLSCIITVVNEAIEVISCHYWAYVTWLNTKGAVLRCLSPVWWTKWCMGGVWKSLHPYVDQKVHFQTEFLFHMFAMSFASCGLFKIMDQKLRSIHPYRALLWFYSRIQMILVLYQILFYIPVIRFWNPPFGWLGNMMPEMWRWLFYYLTLTILCMF